MVETITPVVYGGRARWAAALALHVAGCDRDRRPVRGGARRGRHGARGAVGPRGMRRPGVGGRGATRIGELPRVTASVPQLRRQVPDWWREFFSWPIAAVLYGAGLGVGFFTTSRTARSSSWPSRRSRRATAVRGRDRRGAVRARREASPPLAALGVQNPGRLPAPGRPTRRARPSVRVRWPTARCRPGSPRSRSCSACVPTAGGPRWPRLRSRSRSDGPPRRRQSVRPLGAARSPRTGCLAASRRPPRSPFRRPRRWCPCSSSQGGPRVAGVWALSLLVVFTAEALRAWHRFGPPGAVRVLRRT